MLEVSSLPLGRIDVLFCICPIDLQSAAVLVALSLSTSSTQNKLTDRVRAVQAVREEADRVGDECQVVDKSAGPQIQ